MRRPQQGQVVERREHDRYDVSLAGELIWDGGASRQRCTIRDISLDGARVDTGFFVAVPQRVFLLDKGTANLFECEVRWHHKEKIGLFFIDIGSRANRRSLIKWYLPTP
jgi:hypothetical protein